VELTWYKPTGNLGSLFSLLLFSAGGVARFVSALRFLIVIRTPSTATPIINYKHYGGCNIVCQHRGHCLANMDGAQPFSNSGIRSDGYSSQPIPTASLLFAARWQR
jgi:hypothetical protein